MAPPPIAIIMAAIAQGEVIPAWIRNGPKIAEVITMAPVEDPWAVFRMADVMKAVTSKTHPSPARLPTFSLINSSMAVPCNTVPNAAPMPVRIRMGPDIFMPSSIHVRVDDEDLGIRDKEAINPKERAMMGLPINCKMVTHLPESDPRLRIVELLINNIGIRIGRID